MVDLDRIHQRLELLAGYLRELRRLRDLPVAEYLRHEVYAGRYLVQVAAQTCLDLAHHLIASEGWRAPRDFGDSFTILHEQGVIDDALAGRLRGLAGCGIGHEEGSAGHVKFPEGPHFMCCEGHNVNRRVSYHTPGRQGGLL